MSPLYVSLIVQAIKISKLSEKPLGARWGALLVLGDVGTEKMSKGMWRLSDGLVIRKKTEQFCAGLTHQ
jgi:hypothetical protein